MGVIYGDDLLRDELYDGTYSTYVERKHSPLPSVIVIGGGISGISAARMLQNACIKVTLLESQNRIGGRICTDYSLGYPVDMGASWLHGVCNENPLSPIIRRLGLKLYRTSVQTQFFMTTIWKVMHSLMGMVINFPKI